MIKKNKKVLSVNKIVGVVVWLLLMIIVGCPSPTSSFTAGSASIIGRIFANDSDAKDQFGRPVSMDGNTVIVGAHGDGSGSAYIFVHNGADWIQQAKINATDGDNFGVSADISGDTAIVGSYRYSFSRGSAYVFSRDGTNWAQQAKLTASDGASSDEFGISVAIDGDIAIVGSWEHNNYSGAAYVFIRDGTNWTEKQKLIPSDGEMGAKFGVSVAIDSNIAIIGALEDGNGLEGSAYIFHYDSTNSIWKQQTKLSPNDLTGHFGVSVAIDGGTVLVGAELDDDNRTAAGAVYVFVNSGTNWAQQQKLKPNDGTRGDFFGISVALESDVALIGSSQHYSSLTGTSGRGKAYVFTRVENSWRQSTKILADDAADQDAFGYSVVLKDDMAIISAIFDDTTNGGEDSGSVYVYQLNR